MAWATIAAVRDAGSLPRYASAIIPGPITAHVAGAVIATVWLAGSLAAQGFAVRPKIQGEIHAAVIVSGTSSAVAGVGVNVPAGLYARLAAEVAAGSGIAGSSGRVVRVALVTRFLTDPFHESRWAPYIGGGVAGVWRERDRGRPALLAVVGTDLPVRGGWTPSLELALGAGAQVRLALRRTRTQGR